MEDLHLTDGFQDLSGTVPSTPAARGKDTNGDDGNNGSLFSPNGKSGGGDVGLQGRVGVNGANAASSINNEGILFLTNVQISDGFAKSQKGGKGGIAGTAATILNTGFLNIDHLAMSDNVAVGGRHGFQGAGGAKGQGGNAVDALRGLDGDDTYLRGKTSGRLFLGDRAENATSGDADLAVFNDLNFSDLTLSDLNGALRMQWSDGAASGEVRIAGLAQHIEEFQFADGTVLAIDDFLPL
jgi:hypothetical protein